MLPLLHEYQTEPFCTHVYYACLCTCACAFDLYFVIYLTCVQWQWVALRFAPHRYFTVQQLIHKIHSLEIQVFSPFNLAHSFIVYCFSTCESSSKSSRMQMHEFVCSTLYATFNHKYPYIYRIWIDVEMIPLINVKVAFVMTYQSFDWCSNAAARYRNLAAVSYSIDVFHSFVNINQMNFSLI